MNHSALAAVALLCLSGAAASQSAGSYDMCGTLVPGVTCEKLFEDTNGHLFVLDTYGSFVLGDVVHVTGTHDPGCFTTCNQGNGCILGNTIDSCGSLGTSYCFCDTVAPCGNLDATAGCANTSGSGASVSASGSASVSADNLAFLATNLLPNQPALLFVGDDALNNGDGIVFGDGLRCAGNNVVRLGTEVPDANGEANWGPGLGGLGGWSSGDVRRFQVWYRDPSGGGACGNAFNLTHGAEITFVP